jgi:hypothetical protein
MNTNDELYEKAAQRAATLGQRSYLWEVHGHYEVRKLDNGNRIAVATPLESADLDQEEWAAVQKRLANRKKSGLEYREAMGRRYGTTLYAPLIERPALFVKFSRLGDSGEVSSEQWIEWVKENGVLGKSVGSRGDRTRDVYSVFVEEARLASRTRRLFEMATRPRKPDVEAIMNLLPQEYADVGEDPRRVEQTALEVVAEIVQREVRQGCVPRILPRENFRQSRRSALLYQTSFSTLIAAMWQQFMWLSTGDKTRYCEYCGGMLSPERRRDARFCGEAEGKGKACKQAAKRERDRDQRPQATQQQRVLRQSV